MEIIVLMVALFVSAAAALGAVALSSTDDGPDGFSSA